MVRKLGRPAKERVALLRNQVSELLWFGSLETTVYKAKEIRPIAEKLITLAMKTANDTVTVKKTKIDENGNKVEVDVINDGPKKLAARRKIMSFVRDLQERQAAGEKKADFKKRSQDVNHPLVEKLFGEYAEKFNKRKEEGKCGGYTRIYKLGQRRGDAAEMAKIEII